MKKEDSAKSLEATRFAEKLSMWMCEQTITETLAGLNVKIVERIRHFIMTKVQDGSVKLNEINLEEIQNTTKDALKDALKEIIEKE